MLISKKQQNVNGCQCSSRNQDNSRGENRETDGQNINQDNSRRENRETYGQNIGADEQGTAGNGPGQHLQESYLRQLCLTGSLTFFILVTLAVVSMVFITSLTDTGTPLTFAMLYDIIQLVIVCSVMGFSAIGVVSLIFVLNRLSSEQLAINDSKEIVVEAALPMISLAGLYLAQGIELTSILDIAYLNNILSKHHPSSCQHLLNTERLTGFLTVLFGSLQTLFIIGSLGLKKVRRNADNDGKSILDERSTLHLCIKIVAIVILICNFTLWLIKTFELPGLYCHPFFYKFYGSSWLQLSDIAYPLWISSTFPHLHHVLIFFASTAILNEQP
jgi:hypothetical protein